MLTDILTRSSSAIFNEKFSIFEYYNCLALSFRVSRSFSRDWIKRRNDKLNASQFSPSVHGVPVDDDDEEGGDVGPHSFPREP